MKTTDFSYLYSNQPPTQFFSSKENAENPGKGVELLTAIFSGFSLYIL